MSGGGRHSFSFCDLISVDNLLCAWKEFSRGKKSKKDVARFELNLEDNIFQLHETLTSGTWASDPYVAFYVQDPKLRRIHKASVRDRVLHQAVYRALYLIFDTSFIHDSYSSRDCKGTHRGVRRFREFARKVTANYSRSGFALKCDIRRFFDSIDHEVLISILRKKISDEKLLDLVIKIIQSFSVAPSKGLPLGNVTSQILANVYMNEFDQFMKHDLKTKQYIRYCDDFVILHDSREFLGQSMFKMRNFLSERLRLDIHPNKISLRKFHQGVDFLGYVSLPRYTVLRTSTKRRLIKKICEAHARYILKIISLEHLNQVVTSYVGMLSHCKSHKIKKSFSCYIHPMSHTSTLLDGRIVRAERSQALAERIRRFPVAPMLAIIQVGNRPDSAAYIAAKKSFAERIGARINHVYFAEQVSEQEVISAVIKCNADDSIDGVIVQLPLPAQLDSTKIINLIDPKKDVDGLTDTNQILLAKNDSAAIIPATARGVMELLQYYHIDLKGKKVAVVGRSRLVGTPIAHVCAHAGADVIVCHSKTVDIAHETRKADIVIVAVGKNNLIGANHVKEGAVVVDVGINRTEDGSLKGDVDFDAIKNVALAITPVPGGVGQMTVLALFENLVDACKISSA